MSLLMDALRKAEEAKKKAELEGKSKPVVADTAEKAADPSPDIEIEFEPVLNPEPSPERSPAPTPEYLIDDLAAHVADTVAIEEESTLQVPAQDEPAEEEPGRAPPDPEATPDYTRPAASITPAARVAISKSAEPAVSRPAVSTTTSAAYDDYSIDFEASPPATAAGEPGPAVAPKPAISVRQQESITQRMRAQRETGTNAHSVDTSLEEQDRRSARSVFAAKRKASPLTKNLQLTAISIAAVLLVMIGTYLYISLRTGSGISMPVADQGFQQPQREFTEAELELTDADLADTSVADSLLTTSPARNVVAEPAIDVRPATTAPAPEQVGNTADTIVSSIPATDVQQSIATTTGVADSPSPTVAVNNNLNNSRNNSPDNSATATDPVSSTASASAAPAASANTAASLQPQRIEPQRIEPQRIEPQQIEPRAEQESLVSFTRRAAAPAGNPLTENAYSFYQSGNLEQAEHLYREALASEPLNRNALLGLAAIAAYRNDTVEALELYSRLLARDPSDPVAKAGLLEIMPRGNLQQQETELLRMQGQNPDIAPLAYAVGNFMASQQRWSEAQQAYFSALQLAKNDAQGNPVNPDYAFNLAVSLEHIGQSRVAGNYYREALTLAEAHPAGFSVDMARQRLISMESASNE